MSDLLNDCMTVLRTAGFDLVPADDIPQDVIRTGGKVRDWGIEQRNAAHGQILAPVAIMPGAIVPAGRRVVHVTHMDGTTETDLEWLARQAELDDCYQTMHDASYRGQ